MIGLKKNFLIWFLFFAPVLTYALGMDDFELNHLLSVGGGVSSPSMTSALLGENPAGFMYNSQTKFLGELAWTNSNMSPLGAGGLVYFGNGSVGGGIGVQSFNGQGDNAGSLTLLNFGIGSEIPQWNISFGATGSYVLSRTGGTVGTGSDGEWNTDLGVIFNPRGDVRFGVTTYQVIGGVEAIGAGISGDPNAWATFSLDGTATPKGHGKTIKPAMGIHLMDFQFVIGYGIRLDDDPTSWIRRGSSFGVGFRINYNIDFQAYYNQLALYYLGLTIKF